MPCIAAPQPSLRGRSEVLQDLRVNLRARQLLLGHSQLESTVRHLGVDIEDAISLSEDIEI